MISCPSLVFLLINAFRSSELEFVTHHFPEHFKFKIEMLLPFILFLVSLWNILGIGTQHIKASI